jgi:hypothetical protein
MNLLILLQDPDLGSLPTPPPHATTWLDIVGEAFPLFLAGMMFVAMALVTLYRYNRRFHDFWEEHICGWIEEHGHRCE